MAILDTIAVFHKLESFCCPSPGGLRFAGLSGIQWYWVILKPGVANSLLVSPWKKQKISDILGSLILWNLHTVHVVVTSWMLRGTVPHGKNKTIWPWHIAQDSTGISQSLGFSWSSPLANCYTTRRNINIFHESRWINYINLVGGLEHVLFSHILGISSSQLTFIFFRGVAQPPTKYRWPFGRMYWITINWSITRHLTKDDFALIPGGVPRCRCECVRWKLPLRLSDDEAPGSPGSPGGGGRCGNLKGYDHGRSVVNLKWIWNGFGWIWMDLPKILDIISMNILSTSGGTVYKEWSWNGGALPFSEHINCLGMFHSRA